MNSSIEMRRDYNEDLNTGFIYEIENDQDISISDSEIDNYYLETSDIDNSLLEQFRAASAYVDIPTHVNNKSDYLQSFASYESRIKNVSTTTTSSSSVEIKSNKTTSSSSSTSSPSSIETTSTNNKSVMINCKSFCNYLLKPISNKIKIFKKKSSNNNQIKTSTTQTASIPEEVNCNRNRNNNSEKRYKLKLVKNVQPDNHEMKKSENDKLANNRFTNCGDIVYYNI